MDRCACSVQSSPVFAKVNLITQLRKHQVPYLLHACVTHCLVRMTLSQCKDHSLGLYLIIINCGRTVHGSQPLANYSV